MGQGSGAFLPRLDGVAVEHHLAAEDPRAILLARTLTELGIAEPCDWQHSPSRYLVQTLNRWIVLHGGDESREHFSLDATLTNNPMPFGSDDLDPRRLYLTVHATEAGYIVIGPTLEILKRVHPRLPATFYRLLIGSVSRWLRVYDFIDARERVEIWKEWIEQQENPYEFEIPDVEGSIPAAMKEKLLGKKALQVLTSGVRDEDIRRLIQAALDLSKPSHRLQPPQMSDAVLEALRDANPPLPALLVSFTRADAISALFDEEAQNMLEADPEPSLIAEIEPGDARSVKRAFDTLGAMCRVLAAASRLMAKLPGNNREEYRDGNPC